MSHNTTNFAFGEICPNLRALRFHVAGINFLFVDLVSGVARCVHRLGNLTPRYDIHISQMLHDFFELADIFFDHAEDE